jgi:hypothetical protein
MLLAAALTSLPAARAEGIGVYPTSLRFDDSLRGGEYQATIGVLNRATEERTFSLRADGAIGDWFSFSSGEPGTEVRAAPGGEAQAVVTVAVPPDAANGTYLGSVIVEATVAADNSSGASAVGVGVEIGVEVVVTGTQQLAARLLAVTVPPVEVGMPVRIQAQVENSGNVQVIPVVTVAIASGAGVAAASLETTAPVRPQSQRTIEATWDTSRAFAGDYHANVALNIPGLEAESRTVRFTLAEAGTFTRAGELLQLRLANEPQAGLAARLVAVFRNTGEIETEAVFVGELQRDGALVREVRTLGKRVPPGVAEELEVLLKIPEAGTYTLSGRVNFDGNETAVRDITFTVALPGQADSAGGWGAVQLGLGVGLASAVGLSLGAYAVRKRRGAIGRVRHGRSSAPRAERPASASAPAGTGDIERFFDDQEARGRRANQEARPPSGR